MCGGAARQGRIGSPVDLRLCRERVVEDRRGRSVRLEGARRVPGVEVREPEDLVTSTGVRETQGVRHRGRRVDESRQERDRRPQTWTTRDVRPCPAHG